MSEAEQHILYAVEHGVATITLNRPEVHNAFNETVIKDLDETFKKAGADKDVRVVILRGNGKSFSAGGDLNWMRRTAEYSYEQNVEDAMQLGKLLKTINTLEKPTIALVQGNAFGGGVGLTACCDIAIAEEGTRFCLSEVRIGLIPSIIAPYVMNAMGPRMARRYFMTAERFDAATAQRIGFIHEVCPVGGLDAAAEKIVESIMEGAPEAQARGKKLILNITGRVIDEEVINVTATQIAEARASEEGKEGLSAFLDKREPLWRQLRAQLKEDLQKQRKK
ncbi:MAG: enoyl-CoA hydratase/isomerase family protein [Alphaproteobacteria bacterium]|nr:enoyl-CoA hydratase/isomerase family protein [Alphaproteobacteria bacterium]